MKKSISVLIIIIICVIPLAFTTTFPLMSPRRLHLDTIQVSEHTRSFEQPKKYNIHLEQGNQYTIIVDVNIFWALDVVLRISESPYMLTGYRVDTVSYTGETMHFTAPHTGDYYIQVFGSSGSGFFDIGVETGITSPATGPNVNFFNGTYLIILILPTALILLVGLVILLIINRRKKSSLIKKPYTVSPYRKVEKEEEEVKFCQYCGNQIDSNVARCPHCNTPLK